MLDQDDGQRDQRQRQRNQREQGVQAHERLRGARLNAGQNMTRAKVMRIRVSVGMSGLLLGPDGFSCARGSASNLEDADRGEGVVVFVAHDVRLMSALALGVDIDDERDAHDVETAVNQHVGHGSGHLPGAEDVGLDQETNAQALFFRDRLILGPQVDRGAANTQGTSELSYATERFNGLAASDRGLLIHGLHGKYTCHSASSEVTTLPSNLDV